MTATVSPQFCRLVTIRRHEMNLENTVETARFYDYAEVLPDNADIAMALKSLDFVKYLANAPFTWIDFSYRLAINFFDESVDKSFGANFIGMGGALKGTAIGDICTDNLSRLLNKTVSYKFRGTESTFVMDFFDEHENLLGSFQYDSFLLFGDGDGTGSWF
jgi:hypothetical protein